jgi:hypothetical protein
MMLCNPYLLFDRPASRRSQTQEMTMPEDLTNPLLDRVIAGRLDYAGLSPQQCAEVTAQAIRRARRMRAEAAIGLIRRLWRQLSGWRVSPYRSRLFLALLGPPRGRA